jgi:ribonuclease G
MIARQLRLRNLGGIIIIDFIDMTSDENRAAVLSELRRAVAKDHTKLTVSEFTELGLVEMTRKRTRESLAHVLCESCPICGGRGEIKTARTVCYEIMRETLREFRQYQDAKSFKVLASQSVIDFFLEDESAALDLLQEMMGKVVTLEVEPSYSQEQFDVVIL